MLRRLKMVNFDLGGTFVNLGSTAPMKAIDLTLTSRGIFIKEQLIWEDMGLPKWEHLSKLFQKPRVANQFQSINNRLFDPKRDLSDIFRSYQENQLEVLRTDPESTQMVPHMKQLIEYLKSNNIKICLTSGYTRPMVNVITESLFNQGFVADFNISSSEAKSRGEMNMKCCEQFSIFHLDEALAIGDTLEDAKGAQEACMGFIGIESKHCTRQQFREAGANVSVPDVSHIEGLIEEDRMSIQDQLDVVYTV
jgi:HAD superfamily hydrolase (TIGR01549 family)